MPPRPRDAPATSFGAGGATSAIVTSNVGILRFRSEHEPRPLAASPAPGTRWRILLPGGHLVIIPTTWVAAATLFGWRDLKTTTCRHYRATFAPCHTWRRYRLFCDAAPLAHPTPFYFKIAHLAWVGIALSLSQTATSRCAKQTALLLPRPLRTFDIVQIRRPRCHLRTLLPARRYWRHRCPTGDM